MTTRHEYVEKAKSQLDVWNARIAKVEANLGEVELDAKVAYRSQLDQLRAKRDEAAQKINEIESTSDDAWRDIQSSLTKAWDELENGFQKATRRLS